MQSPELAANRASSPGGSRRASKIMPGESLISGVRLKQILDSLETGDLLPEADIVCNIVDKLERNINIAACLVQFANYAEVLR